MGGSTGSAANNKKQSSAVVSSPINDPYPADEYDSGSTESGYTAPAVTEIKKPAPVKARKWVLSTFLLSRLNVVMF